MASSNIKLFDENKGNMLSDSEFSISNQRMNGLQTGVASSQLQNKAMYQASLIAYAIAQVMMQNGKNANDTDAVSAFVANLSGTMLQKVYDIATTAEAQAGVATGKWMSPALVKAAIDYKFANAVTFGNTVTLAGDPTENLQAVTKQYVDKSITDPYDLKWKLYDKIDIATETSDSTSQKTITFTKEINGPVTEVMYHMHLVHLTSSQYTASRKRLYISSPDYIVIEFIRGGFTIPTVEEDAYSKLQIYKTESLSSSSLGQKLYAQFESTSPVLFTKSDISSGYVHSNIIFSSTYVGCGAGSYIELLYR